MELSVGHIKSPGLELDVEGGKRLATDEVVKNLTNEKRVLRGLTNQRPALRGLTNKSLVFTMAELE